MACGVRCCILKTGSDLLLAPALARPLLLTFAHGWPTTRHVCGMACVPTGLSNTQEIVCVSLNQFDVGVVTNSILPKYHVQTIPNHHTLTLPAEQQGPVNTVLSSSVRAFGRRKVWLTRHKGRTDASDIKSHVCGNSVPDV